MLIRPILALCLTLLAASSISAQSPTVDAVRKAGTLTCGVDQSEAEYSMTDEHGPRVDFDHDLCNAVAAAILGQPHRAILKGYPDEDTALKALTSGEVDMVASVSDDLSHATLPGVALTRPILYDWKTILVPLSLKATHAAQLTNQKICFLGETEGEVDLRSWFTRHHLVFVPFPFQEEGEMEAAFITNNCAALYGDATRLANTRAAFGPHAADYIFLPEVIAQDPLASAARRDDPIFANIVQWTIEVLLLAEEQGVTAKNVSAIHAGQNVTTDRLLDTAHALGKPLGLEHNWTRNVIAAVGNYADLYRRDLGDRSPLKLPRPPTPRGFQPLPFK